jgi:hypothetical protein
MVPSLDWFLYSFVRKEAVVASQIEGTHATPVDSPMADRNRIPIAKLSQINAVQLDVRFTRAAFERDGIV